MNQAYKHFKIANPHPFKHSPPTTTSQDPPTLLTSVKQTNLNHLHVYCL